MQKVTVFSTIYNIAEHLPRFFESMEKQSFTDYKHLIIDDGSDDESYDICLKQAEKDKRIEVLHVEHIGISSARNLILPMLSTPYATSVDGDDVYEENYLLHLVEAQEKYNADMVSSRVAFRDESYKKIWENPKRGEVVIDEKDFPQVLPGLLEEERLNFLYGRLYKSEFLKDIRVDDDVEQGSDIMINCQYLKKTKRIVLIDDLDANRIIYSSGSVTAYKGVRLYKRLYRINKYVMDSFQESGYLNSEMQRVIDKRIFRSLRWAIECLVISKVPFKEAIETVERMANDSFYIDAYERQKQRGDLKPYGFLILSPDEALPFYIEKQIDHMEKKLKKAENDKNSIIRQKKDLEEAIFFLEHSASFRIGRSLTFPGRKLRDFVKKRM